MLASGDTAGVREHRSMESQEAAGQATFWLAWTRAVQAQVGECTPSLCL